MRSRTPWSALLANILVSAALIGAYAVWLAPHAPRLAVLDVGELYRLKEAQVAALLTRSGVDDAQRVAALERAAAFGTELEALLGKLPAECDCLVLARGAVVGDGAMLSDLTPELRRRLGL